MILQLSSEIKNVLLYGVYFCICWICSLFACDVNKLIFLDEKMPSDMKEFYLSVQPQYTQKKERVITPTRPLRQSSQSGTPSKSAHSNPKMPKSVVK